MGSKVGFVYDTKYAKNKTRLFFVLTIRVLENMMYNTH